MNTKDRILEKLNEAKVIHKVDDLTITVEYNPKNDPKEVDRTDVEVAKSAAKAMKLKADNNKDDRYGTTHIVTVTGGGKTAKFSVYQNDVDYKGKHMFAVRSIDKVVPELKSRLIKYLEN